jgi:hypothetical protein
MVALSGPRKSLKIADIGDVSGRRLENAIMLRTPEQPPGLLLFTDARGWTSEFGRLLPGIA